MSSILMLDAGNPYVTIDDLAKFHIKSGPLRDSKPTRHVTPITDVPTLRFENLGGGKVRFKISAFKDSKKASKLKGTQIEVRWLVQLPDAPRPTLISELITDYISSKANFIRDYGSDSVGKYLFASCRWIVITNPALNGEWCDIERVIVA